MNFIYSDCFSSFNKGIKDIFAKIFSFNHNFLLFSMASGIKSCQSVDTICQLRNSTCNRSRIKPKHASTTNDRYLWSSWYQNIYFWPSNDSIIFKVFLYLCFQVRTFRKTTNHEYKIDWCLLALSSKNEFFNFSLNLVE